MSVHAHEGPGPHDPDVYRITTADPGLTEEQRSRTRRYLVSMTIRTLCFVGAVLAPNPWRWVLFVGAFLLPYIAVVMANAGQERGNGAPLSVFVRPRRAGLTPGEEPAPAQDERPG